MLRANRTTSTRSDAPLYNLSYTNTYTFPPPFYIGAHYLVEWFPTLYALLARVQTSYIFYSINSGDVYNILRDNFGHKYCRIIYIYIYIYSRSALATFEVFTPSVHGRHNIIYIYIHLCLRSYVYSCVIMHHSFAIYSIRIIYIIYSRVSCIDFFFYLFIIKVRKPQHCIA